MQTDYKSFRTETVERFDKIDISIKEINENIEGIVADYRPSYSCIRRKSFWIFYFGSIRNTFWRSEDGSFASVL